MVRRLLIGMVLGLIVGGLLAAGLVAGLGMPTFAHAGGAVLAYLAAALTGTVTGLVAGKPIWSSGARIEAGLKALFGALMGAGLMFALRQWAGAWVVPSIPLIGSNGTAAIGDLPAVSLPLLAALLGGFFEVDNTGEDDRAGGAKTGVSNDRRRIAKDGAEQVKARVGAANGSGTHDADDEAELASRGRGKR